MNALHAKETPDLVLISQVSFNFSSARITSKFKKVSHADSVVRQDCMRASSPPSSQLGVDHSPHVGGAVRGRLVVDKGAAVLHIGDAEPEETPSLVWKFGSNTAKTPNKCPHAAVNISPSSVGPLCHNDQMARVAARHLAGEVEGGGHE